MITIITVITFITADVYTINIIIVIIISLKISHMQPQCLGELKLCQSIIFKSLTNQSVQCIVCIYYQNDENI